MSAHVLSLAAARARRDAEIGRASRALLDRVCDRIDREKAEFEIGTDAVEKLEAVGLTIIEASELRNLRAFYELKKAGEHDHDQRF